MAGLKTGEHGRAVTPESAGGRPWDRPYLTTINEAISNRDHPPQVAPADSFRPFTTRIWRIFPIRPSSNYVNVRAGGRRPLKNRGQVPPLQVVQGVDGIVRVVEIDVSFERAFFSGYDRHTAIRIDSRTKRHLWLTIR